MGAVFLTENLVSLNAISCVFRRTISVHEYEGKCSSLLLILRISSVIREAQSGAPNDRFLGNV